MGFHDVAFLPSWACFSTFLKHCGRGVGLVNTTCMKTVVGSKQGLPVKYFRSIKAYF